jgi:hypothetical protein
MMVSNSLSRRRHVIASPEICKKPPPPPLPPYPPGGCWCDIYPQWEPSTKKIYGSFVPWLPDLPNFDPVAAWTHSTPDLPWTNPTAATNNGSTAWGPFSVPPGTTAVTIATGYIFSSGRRCSAHKVCQTPGA